MVNSLFTAKSGLAQARTWKNALISSGVITRLFNSKPIWAQLKITDRCNLRCGYCSEYKDHGRHVERATIMRWLSHCSELGVKHVEFIGGEPLLHPDLPALLCAARDLKMHTGLTTNGYLLNEKRANDLIGAGINRLQISIDCIEPNEVTKKAFTSLRPQLDLCAKMEIWLHVNSVLSAETLPHARELAGLLFDLGIPVAFSPAHTRGRLVVGEAKDALLEFFNWLIEKKMQGNPVNMPRFLIDYYKNSITGKSVPWTCEGGCKAFYVDADGQFCLCSHKPTGRNFLDVNHSVLRENHSCAKGCEGECGVSCMIVNSFPFNRFNDVVRSDLLLFQRRDASD